MVDEDSKLHGLLTGLAKIKTSYWELLIGIVIGLVLGLLVIGSMGEILSIFILLLEGIILLRLPKSETSIRGNLVCSPPSGGSGKHPGRPKGSKNKKPKEPAPT